MDIKGIAWVGSMYQKFENMCLEVGETLYQDLLSTSSKDIRRLASADLSLNPYLEYGIPKPISSIVKEEATGPVCVKGISDNKLSSSNDVWEDWSTTSFNCDISDNDDGNCDRNDVQTSNEGVECKLKGQQERDICKDTSFDSSPPGAIVSNKLSEMVGKRSSCISSSNIIRTKRKEDTCKSSGLVSQMGSQATSNTSSSQSVEEDLPHLDSEYSRTSLSRTHSDTSANTQRGQPADDVVLPPHTGTLIDSASNLKEEKEHEISVKVIEPIGHESESASEETCVIVDGNDYRPHNHKEEIRQSYKKKIQRVFSLKKKPSRKQEYKQLAAESVKFDAELNIHGDEAIRPALSLSENIKSKKLATNESIESEWELL